ncbi:MAG: recombinase RecA [Planctomycetota bacterium]|jgi:recombination protein RecA
MAKKATAKTNVTKIDDAAGKTKVLERTLSEISKRFGQESIMRLGDDNVADVDVIPTGSLSLDAGLGVGGLPKGRIVECFGPESSGKTTLALHAVANCQKQGGTAAFIDAEHALDPIYARKLGVNLDDLLVSQPDCGEQALEIVELLVRSNAVDIVVVDSVAALTPKSELDGEMGDSSMGVQARLMSQAMRKLTGIVKKSNTCVIFINQIRMKIGVMFGSPETTPGGNALKFYCSVRLDIRRIGSIKSGDEVIGNQVKVKVVKNKVAAPFKVVNFDIMFNKGINYEGDLLDIAVNHDIVEKAGAWFSYGETRLGQGRENSCQFIKDNADIMDEIETKVKDILFNRVKTVEEEEMEQKKEEDEKAEKKVDKKAGKKEEETMAVA